MNRDIKECLVCGCNNLRVYCDLGNQPLANNLKNNALDVDIKYPILVNECPICTHKQLSIAIDPQILFSNYLYQTGTSQSHRDFFKQIARVISIKGKGSIFDIGCNDGSLLKEFKNLGWEIFGIDPCEEMVKENNKNDIPTACGYFPDQYPYSEFDVITAFNVFAHNNEPYKFLNRMKELLKPNGRIYILTTPASIANFYHEHISYFTPLSMNLLASKCGLEIKSIIETPMHGNSYLFEIVQKKELDIPHKDLLMGLYQPVVGYGSSAGATVLLNYFEFYPEYVVDDNPLKQGKFIPGTNTPICDSKRLELDPRNLTILILAHNLYDEITKKIRTLRPNAHDTFINPIKGTIK